MSKRLVSELLGGSLSVGLILSCIRSNFDKSSSEWGVDNRLRSGAW